MARTINQINKELRIYGGEREVLRVKRLENNHVVLLPPYIEMSIPKSMIHGNTSRLKKGDDIIVNKLAIRSGIGLKIKYYLPKKLKEVV